MRLSRQKERYLRVFCYLKFGIHYLGLTFKITSNKLYSIEKTVFSAGVDKH